jgi:hypothetical protein
MNEKWESKKRKKRREEKRREKRQSKKERNEEIIDPKLEVEWNPGECHVSPIAKWTF